jgi:hypothetical protein
MAPAGASKDARYPWRLILRPGAKARFFDSRARSSAEPGCNPESVNITYPSLWACAESPQVHHSSQLSRALPDSAVLLVPERSIRPAALRTS